MKLLKTSNLKKIIIDIVKPTSLKVGFIINIFFIVMLCYHYLLSKNSLDVIDSIERVIYDMRFKLRGPIPESGKVGALTADDRSIEKFGRWPFPRDIYPQVLANLKKAGVQWIGFDVFFSEPSRRYLDESVSEINAFLSNNDKTVNPIQRMEFLLKNSPGDLSFAKSIEDFGSIIQGFFFIEQASQLIGSNYNWESSFTRLQNSAIDFIDFPTGKSIENYEDLISPGAVTNTALIAGSSKHMGFANNQTDEDGIVRKSVLIKAIQPTNSKGEAIGKTILLPSLALSATANYLNAGIVVHFDNIGPSNIELLPSDSKIPQISIPLYYDGLGKMLINHYGPFHEIPQISLLDAFENKIPKNLPPILIYGGTATGTNDKRPSPFDKNFDGVGHHIAIIDNILTQNYMKRPVYAPFIEISLLFFTGILISLSLKYMNAIRAALFVIFVTLSFYLIDKYYLFGKGNWYYVGTFYAQSISIYLGITVFKYFTEEREKKKVKGAFQHYLNPDVINQLMEHPEKLKLGGEKKILTVFFSDVRGFTTISESLSAERLTALLNEYFTPMTDIVLKSNGLLDKYIGDAMMAVWGAPIPIEDHADRALTASLEMLEKLKILQDKWEKEGLPYLDIGIGLNTGEMVVGNMGSHQRFDYTVLGDSVNLGARLEGINKNYGTRVICSEFTKRALKHPENFILRELDNIQVKGKHEPVRIFEVMSGKNIDREKLAELIKCYEEGLQFYRSQQWKKAQEKFTQALEINSADQPSQEFLKRTQQLEKDGVDPGWDGVWIFKTK